MMKMDTLGTRSAVVIPAYEPDEKLIRLTEALIGITNLDLVVVDDGSGKNYQRIFGQLPSSVYLLTHEKNRGKGAAMKTAFSYIMAEMPEIQTIVTADSDGQHTPEDILRVLMAARADRDALVLGVRRFTGNVPLRSRIGNDFTRELFTIVSGAVVSDTQTGLRAFDRSFLPDLLAISGDRYEYEMDMLMEAAKCQVPIREVEIKTVYLDENKSSHYSTVRDSLRIAKRVLKFSASSIIGFCVDFSLFYLFGRLLDLTPVSAAAAAAVANVGARVISATVNFTLNRKFVFAHKGNIKAAATKYFSLAVWILLINTVMVTWLSVHLGMNRMAAKLVTEITLFFVSYLAQRFFVFRGEKAPEDEEKKQSARNEGSAVYWR